MFGFGPPCGIGCNCWPCQVDRGYYMKPNTNNKVSNNNIETVFNDGIIKKKYTKNLVNETIETIEIKLSIKISR